MFRYVADEFNKLFNSKINSVKQNTVSNDNTHTARANHNQNKNSLSTSTSTDLNNNNLLDIPKDIKKKSNKTLSSNRSKVDHKQDSWWTEKLVNDKPNISKFVEAHQESLLDEFDWFKPKHNSEFEPSSHKKRVQNIEKLFNLRRKSSCEQLARLFEQKNNDLVSLASSYDTYYEDLSREYSFENLKNNKYRQRTFKMLTSYDKDEFLYTYLDNHADNELVDSLKLSALKAVQVFQKKYYQEPVKGEKIIVPDWRMKEKMKTVNAALIMCLNIGVDPPDIVKTNQSSKLECWINQITMNPQKALETICAELQKQYERWQPRARYKSCADPTAEEVKKLCISLRKNAKEERVLFHYNGHGVPRPTVNGEIWVFNKEFTQYIPLSLYEVQTWMGTPSFYVWDCSNAGIIIQNFLQFEEDRENELLQKSEANADSLNRNASTIRASSNPPKRDSIHLAACSKNELLPMHPDLPLDLFTACLTTPIKAALHWYVSQKNLCQLVPGLTLDLLEKIPGLISDRRTMMGELNWIFTAITDTIAWNVLDSALFQKLFRQDLLVASLFRNFLLAERIMKSLDCTPVSHPSLPSTHEHPLWQSWDLALDMCISQLPQILNNPSHPKDFISCGFFTEQIEIFDVWLRFNVSSHTPPEQLPVVLQVLLSQQHRLKALELLGKFLDFGPWAVSSALSVGIFPYVLKLLTTQHKELRPLLTFIWAKILAVDKSCQAELVKDNGHAYFISALNDPNVEPTHKVYSVFVISCLVDNYSIGQESAKQNHLISDCTYLITDKSSADYQNPLLRQWCCICLGLCWQNYPDARWEGVRNTAHKSLIELISDPVPEVRAAAIFALGTYIGCGPGNEGSLEQTNKLDSEIVNALIKDYDIVFIVRKELIAALFNYINQFLNGSSLGSNSNGIMSMKMASSSGQSSLASNSSMTKSHSSSAIAQQNPGNSKQQSTINTIQENMSPVMGPKQSPLTPRLVQSTSNQGINNSASQSSEYYSNQSSLNSNAVNSLTSPISSLNIANRLQNLGPQPVNQPIQPSNTGLTIPLILSNPNILFNKVWNLLIDMQNDPYPDVAEFAQKVVSFFVTKAHCFDRLKRNTILQNFSQFNNNNNRRFSNDLTNKTNQMSDNGAKIQADTISISTDFVPWCRNYFLKPLLPTQPSMKTEELLVNRPVDIYTAEFLDQHCKLLYNHKVKRRMPNEWHEAQYLDETTLIKHNTLPIHCKFHPYDDMLFVADKDSMIHVYDTQNKTTNQNAKLLSFSNASTTQTNKKIITSFKIINSQHEPMVLTGTEDRIVRLFKPDLMYHKSNQLVTAFSAFGENEKKNSTQKEAGLIIEWDEPNEILMCAGDTGHIRLWDMTKELYTDYQTHVSSCVSSLTTHDNFTVAGFGDGTVKLFDFRRPNPVTLVNGLDTSMNIVHQHNVFVLKVKIHKPTLKLISSSTRGDIKVFDLRNMQDYLKTTMNNEMATAVECHPINELIAVANTNQSIKVYDFKDKELANIKFHEGFLRRRIAAVTCLNWNYYKNEIVFGGQDNHLSVFSCKENNN